MRVMICGSRKYVHVTVVQAFIKALPPETLVIAGGAQGVDKWAEQSAKYHKLETMIFPAKWRNPDGTLNRGAGFNRNLQMIEQADVVVAFWDFNSRGTAHSIFNAKTKLAAIYNDSSQPIDNPAIFGASWERIAAWMKA